LQSEYTATIIKFKVIDPVECARVYCETGADELALLDITATVEGRATMLDVVERVAEVTTVPFTVGGGISDVESAELVLSAGSKQDINQQRRVSEA
jgi:cyclase